MGSFSCHQNNSITVIGIVDLQNHLKMSPPGGHILSSLSSPSIGFSPTNFADSQTSSPLHNIPRQSNNFTGANSFAEGHAPTHLHNTPGQSNNFTGANSFDHQVPAINTGLTSASSPGFYTSFLSDHNKNNKSNDSLNSSTHDTDISASEKDQDPAPDFNIHFNSFNGNRNNSNNNIQHMGRPLPDFSGLWSGQGSGQSPDISDSNAGSPIGGQNQGGLETPACPPRIQTTLGAPSRPTSRRVTSTNHPYLTSARKLFQSEDESLSLSII